MFPNSYCFIYCTRALQTCWNVLFSPPMRHDWVTCFNYHYLSISVIRLANAFKVAEDDIAFKLAIFEKSLHLNDNTGFCSVIHASKLVFWVFIGKKLLFCPILNKKFCILPDGQLWEWLTGGVALPQPKCNWSVGFAIARWPVGKASDNARIMLSSLFRYSPV